MKRRELLLTLSGCCAGAALTACRALPAKASAARVVVIGGGFGGATAAKYVRLLSNQTIDVVLIEASPKFVSSPLSNLVVGGELRLSDLVSSYDQLRSRHGIKVVHDRAAGVDVDAKLVRLGGGGAVRYQKLVLAPGIDPMVDAIDGLANASTTGKVLQAWAAGAETVALHAQIAAMRDGGVFAITIPEAPYRCPPAPYERASLVAAYLKKHKPRSKVLVLDANQDVIALGALFKETWAKSYDGLLEYRSHCKATAVDAATRTVKFEIADDVRADVLNVLAPVRAGAIAVQAGMANIKSRWCEVEFSSFQSAVAKDVHILGDSIQAAPQMPKSGHMANGQAKVAAAAIVAELSGWDIDPHPMLTNTCYSYVSDVEAVHSAAVYEYLADEHTFKPVPRAGGVSPRPSAEEAIYAMAWAHNAWADMLR